MVVMDESWRMFSHLAIASLMQQSFKLSRASGTMNVLVMHRLSDLVSAGAAGSHQVRLAEGLLADAATASSTGNPPPRSDHARELLGLLGHRSQAASAAASGQALWKVGAPFSLGIGCPQASSPCQHRRPPRAAAGFAPRRVLEVKGAG